MARNILTLLLAAAMVAVSYTTAQICTVPVNEALAPCECLEEDGGLAALQIVCYAEINITDMKAAFERVSPMVDENVVFDQIYMGHPVIGIQIQEIPANIFGSLKTKEIQIYSTSPVTWIDLEAFNSTYEHTLRFISSSLTLMSSEENHALFSVLNKFRNLEELDMRANNISYIPDDPFPTPMPRLKTFLVNLNMVEYLGARVLANLPALEYAEFGYTGINLDMLTPATFEGIGPAVELGLGWNGGISHLPQEIFGQVLNSAAGLVVGGKLCFWETCSYQRLSCDERINWICENIQLYQPKLDGYFCTEGIGVDDIWEYCAALNGTEALI